MLCLMSCLDSNNNKSKKLPKGSIVKCSKDGCSGKYTGPEFVISDDVAHQFSNQMSIAVGDKLKELYGQADYRKVDFIQIVMSTEGMGTGYVNYELKIPFMKVDKKCDAYTSFDHVGGWNHAPAIEKRKEALGAALMKGQALDISELKRTPEGLQEYWIQWKNKDTQAECE